MTALIDSMTLALIVLLIVGTVLKIRMIRVEHYMQLQTQRKLDAVLDVALIVAQTAKEQEPLRIAAMVTDRITREHDPREVMQLVGAERHAAVERRKQA